MHLVAAEPDVASVGVGGSGESERTASVNVPPFDPKQWISAPIFNFIYQRIQPAPARASQPLPAHHNFICVSILVARRHARSAASARSCSSSARGGQAGHVRVCAWVGGAATRRRRRQQLRCAACVRLPRRNRLIGPLAARRQLALRGEPLKCRRLHRKARRGARAGKRRARVGAEAWAERTLQGHRREARADDAGRRAPATYLRFCQTTVWAQPARDLTHT
eukprot:2954649-Pleurochrysis_carterae.AAC.3